MPLNVVLNVALAPGPSVVDDGAPEVALRTLPHVSKIPTR